MFKFKNGDGAKRIFFMTETFSKQIEGREQGLFSYVKILLCSTVNTARFLCKRYVSNVPVYFVRSVRDRSSLRKNCLKITLLLLSFKWKKSSPRFTGPLLFSKKVPTPFFPKIISSPPYFFRKPLDVFVSSWFVYHTHQSHLIISYFLTSLKSLFEKWIPGSYLSEIAFWKMKFWIFKFCR